MEGSLHMETNVEQRVLCSLAFFCLTTALGALVVLGYSLSVQVSSTAGQQMAIVYSRLGI